jgi:hypothetical protein
LKNYPALLFLSMPDRLRRLTISEIVLLGVALIFCISAGAEAPVGFVEGRLKIISIKEVEVAGQGTAKTMAGNFADYPLVVLNKTTRQQVARMTPDRNGNYRMELPAGDYLLDIDRRVGGIARSEAKSFTVSPQRTVRVDMEIDTGIR